MRVNDRQCQEIKQTGHHPKRCPKVIWRTGVERKLSQCLFQNQSFELHFTEKALQATNRNIEAVEQNTKICVKLKNVSQFLGRS